MKEKSQSFEIIYDTRINETVLDKWNDAILIQNLKKMRY